MKKQLFIFLSALALLTTSSCKRCYECSLDQFCATCQDDNGLSVVICSRNFASMQEYEYELNNYSNCSRRSDGQETKEICAKGWFGKTLLVADKEDLEWQGYTCTVK